MNNKKLAGIFLCLITILFAPLQTQAQGGQNKVLINQAGFHPSSVKLAVISDDTAEIASVVNESGIHVFTGPLSASEYWPHSDEEVRLFDFSSVKTTGVYHIKLDSGSESYRFPINRDAISDMGRTALRSFYLIRSGTELKTELAGPWARAAGHPDTSVIVHESAAGPDRESGTIISSPGGWYDAGDYNKYVVNSAITMYFMLMPYEICPTCFPDGSSNIPESGNGKSDLLDEVRFNLDWVLSMQDPADGGVYHKLTSKHFSGFIMPKDDHADRYVVQKSTAATLDFAAIAAYASRQFKATDPTYAQSLLQAAQKAWSWAIQHPDIKYQQPKDISTGTYANPSDNLEDEWSWARVEMFLGTGDPAYLEGWQASEQGGALPGWSYVGPLAWLSLANSSQAPADLKAIAREHIMLSANTLLNAAQSGYRVGLGAYDGSLNDGRYIRDWVWGSNGVAAIQAVMLEQAYRLSENTAYLDVAVGTLDYLLGRNPNGISYLTGVGENHSMNIHSRPSGSDNVVEPVPGLLAGGPNNDHGDKKDCEFDYIDPAPAKSYYDHVCSYASNENAINWNGALVAAAYLVHNSVGVASQLKSLVGVWHDPADVVFDPIGALTLTMNDCNNILMDYVVEGLAGDQELVRTYAVAGHSCTASY